MAWLREHGLISKYDDFAALPIAVLQDARLLMQAEGRMAAKELAEAREMSRGRNR